LLREGVITARERHGLVIEFVHHARAMKQSKFTKGVVHERWPEASVDHLDKAPPRWKAAIELEAVEPELHIIEVE
jgi:hypothetical protein